MKTATPILVIVLALFAFTIVVLAADGSYEVNWYSIDGGGRESSGGGYTLNGTIGQPDAGRALSGGGYTVTGGFWAGAGAGMPPVVYLPLIQR
jgi:hypothetical protein